MTKLGEPDRRRGRLISLWLPVPAYIGLVFLMSAFTVPAAPFGTSDKVLHMLEYAGLGFIVCRAVVGWFPLAPRPASVVVATLFSIACGAIDEWIQSFAPLRTSDLADLAADALGAPLGAIAWVLLLGAWDLVAGERSDSPGSD